MCRGESIFQGPVRRLFFFNDTATTHIYTLSLHDALPISPHSTRSFPSWMGRSSPSDRPSRTLKDRKSTRLNSSHGSNSYAVFSLNKQKQQDNGCVATTVKITIPIRGQQKIP